MEGLFSAEGIKREAGHKPDGDKSLCDSYWLHWEGDTTAGGGRTQNLVRAWLRALVDSGFDQRVRRS